MSRTLPELFAGQFDLCRLQPYETVAVIAELGRKAAYVEAAVAAARQAGAGALVLTASSLSQPVLPPHEADGREVPALLAAAAECDLVVDVTVGGLIHSDVRTSITGNGGRMLFVAEPPDVLERLRGTAGLRQVVEAGGRRLRAGRTLRVTSAAGTDLSADISGGDLPVTQQWGYVDEPGRWDHWPSGFVACFPHDRTAEGQIVLQPGDVLLPWQRYVRDHVTVLVEKGFITEVRGDGADAFLLRDYLDSWHDPDAWATSHLGWGIHPLARWAALDVYDPHAVFGQELRSVAGNFMWSTGPNRFAGRHTPAHLDIPMQGCTVAIDATAVVRDGVLTHEEE